MDALKQIQETIGELTERELQLLFADITALRENKALAEGCPLKRLEKYLGALTSCAEDVSSIVIGHILYVMAGKFAELNVLDCNSDIAGWQSNASRKVCLVHNAAEPALWDYGVFINDVYGAPLGYFNDEVSALRYIAEHGFECTNNGKPIDY